MQEFPCHLSASPVGDISVDLIFTLRYSSCRQQCPSGCYLTATSHRWHFVSAGGGRSRAPPSDWRLLKPCALTTSLVEWTRWEFQHAYVHLWIFTLPGRTVNKIFLRPFLKGDIKCAIINTVYIFLYYSKIITYYYGYLGGTAFSRNPCDFCLWLALRSKCIVFFFHKVKI